MGKNIRALTTQKTSTTSDHSATICKTDERKQLHEQEQKHLFFMFPSTKWKTN